jgi:SAM-dependent methyltransferase
VTTFDAYSLYYDIVYEDKDYGAEALFVTEVLKNQTGLNSGRLLDLGCGTGAHAALFCAQGFDVTGVDLSPGMVARARARAEKEGLKGATFTVGDIREFAVPGAFDVVASLFHVMSYQTRNCDIRAALAMATSHLSERGVLLFDFWYGPAVLSVQPSVRVKRVQNESIAVVRVAEPQLLERENVVKVKYSIWVLNKRTGVTEYFEEVHPMRYFFMPELEAWLEEAGLELVHSCEWLTGGPLNAESWSGFVTARRVTASSEGT